jgi:hypothetical protein
MQPENAQSPTRVRCRCRFDSITLASLCLGLSLCGCGNVLYTYRANGASSKLEAARQAGAEKTALYEYTLAQEHLSKAMSEASEADYGDAAELAQLADEYAAQAVEKARLRMRAQPKHADSVAGKSEGSKTESTGAQE